MSEAPTEGRLDSDLAARRDRLRRSTNADRKYEGRLLGRVINGEVITDLRELAEAAIAIVRAAPAGTTDDQLKARLLGSAGSRHTALPEIIRLAREHAPRVASGTPVRPELVEFSIDSDTGKPHPNQHNVRIALDKLGITLSYDLFAHRKMIERGDVTNVLQDRHVNALRLRFERDFEFLVAKDLFFDILSDFAHANAYHPVLDYLDELPEDAPITGLTERWLIDFAGAEDTPYVRAVSRLVLVAAVRRVREPGAKYDEMVTLESAIQGTEKSSALRALCPDPEWFTDSLPLDAKSKELMEQTAGKWIVEVGELKGQSRAGRAHVKALLSARADHARMAYGRETEYREREFVVFGTTNDEDYLDDPTGGRRFWPVTIKRFDIAALTAARDQLWAEAARLEAEGFSIRLPQALWPAAAEEQAKREVEDPFEILMANALADVVGKIRIEDAWKIAGFDTTYVPPKVPNQGEKQRISNVLRKLGWERVRRRDEGDRGYYYARGNPVEQEIPLRVVGSGGSGWTVGPAPVAAPN